MVYARADIYHSAKEKSTHTHSCDPHSVEQRAAQAATAEEEKKNTKIDVTLVSAR